MKQIHKISNKPRITKTHTEEINKKKIQKKKKRMQRNNTKKK